MATRQEIDDIADAAMVAQEQLDAALKSNSRVYSLGDRYVARVAPDSLTVYPQGQSPLATRRPVVILYRNAAGDDVGLFGLSELAVLARIMHRFASWQRHESESLDESTSNPSGPTT